MVTSKSISKPATGVSLNSTRRKFNLSSRKTKRINLSGKRHIKHIKL
jgi:hypothetical protein